jgi:serine phosphatase RsbU (regulator of sigma subunit)
LLAEMHRLFEDCLPEGVYVEATLVRLLRGEVTVVPAGGSRFLLRRTGREEVELITLRGAWLGLVAPAPSDQHRWALQPDDELVLGTDGLFDQLAAELGRDLEGVRRLKATNLFDRLEQLLRSALQQKAQADDITVVALRRTVVRSNGTGGGRPPQSPHSAGREG